MPRETSKSIARRAARFLSGELKTLTRKQQLSLAASALAQAEAEQESAKAWGVLTKKDGLLAATFETRNNASYHCSPDWGERAIPVLIRRLNTRAKARKRKSK